MPFRNLPLPGRRRSSPEGGWKELARMIPRLAGSPITAPPLLSPARAQAFVLVFGHLRGIHTADLRLEFRYLIADQKSKPDGQWSGQDGARLFAHRHPRHPGPGLGAAVAAGDGRSDRG